MSKYTRENTIVLFDVDGTLTAPRKVITNSMKKTLESLRERVTVGVVGGSNLPKIVEQLGDNALNEYDFLFAENGVIAYQNGKLIKEPKSLADFLGKERFQQLISDLEQMMRNAPNKVKTSTFVEVRTGMINASPIGRDCTQTQRDEFYAQDKELHIRDDIVKVLETKYPAKEWGLKYSIGGQISIDIFPIGWDKTFCLQYVSNFQNIFFFGDKTDLGGNDFEIFTSPKVTNPNKVTSPEDTQKLLQQYFSTV